VDERALVPLLNLQQRRVAECEREDDREVRVVAVADPRMADCAEEPMRAAERKVLVGGQEARLPQELEKCPLWRASRKMQRTQTGAPG
jgi:hypothetical protein